MQNNTMFVVILNRMKDADNKKKYEGEDMPVRGTLTSQLLLYLQLSASAYRVWREERVKER